MMTDNSASNPWQFIDKNSTFRLEDPHLTNHLYFPLVNEAGMMSVISPTLHGDIKTGHNTFFSQPLSIEDLHNNRAARNFWVFIDGREPWSLTGNSAAQVVRRFGEDPEEVTLEAGLLWHSLRRRNRQLGLETVITNFVPASEDQVEMMRVTVTNSNPQPLTLVPTAAVPIFGRSADNLRDHRHVTSLLHRITCHESGVLVRPTLSFDERGHNPNKTTYAVLGRDQNGLNPEGFFPLVEDFIGGGGSLDWPRAIVENSKPTSFAGHSHAGYEALGGVRFPEISLRPGESHTWVLILAIMKPENQAEELLVKFGSPDHFDDWLARTKKYWQEKSKCLIIQTGDPRFDGWMRWISIQPILRRLYGNSFMPYHDYGRGGRGWRDLWQDILALLLLEPVEIDSMLLSNFAGVRIDGSNATIIGGTLGEFKADRIEIPRVWMDHGAWPMLTMKLYIDQTGDLGFLLKEQTYFKDHLIHWTKAIDDDWNPEQGTKLRTVDGEVYLGTVLEHLLVQHLTSFFNVGAHNNLRLEGADWNDGLDMAPDKGESVAFTAVYASNLRQLADLVMQLKTLGQDSVLLASEILLLLDSMSERVDYGNPIDKRQRLTEYFTQVGRKISGVRQKVALEKLAQDLRAKAEHIYTHFREHEWLQDDQGLGWFNGYYDNDGMRLEGRHPLGVRMTLTGQVLALMGGIATDEQAGHIVRAVDHYLFDPLVGGYRLNTDFGEPMMNLGRAFDFAYRHKENGAMFSHMAVMYANALYQRGYVKEGFKALDAIYHHSVDFSRSRIYPGIPEYFNDRGRGMYPYLTGSTSWYLLTMVTEVFGVRGHRGDLLLMPKLRRGHFDAQGRASIHTLFGGQRLQIVYENVDEACLGDYFVHKIFLNGQTIEYSPFKNGAFLSREGIARQPKDVEHRLDVVLNTK